MGGGGGTKTTTTASNAYPAEFAPLAASAVQQIQGMQGLLPLQSFAKWMPQGTAGLSPAQQFAMNDLLPSTLQMGEGTRGLLALPASVGRSAMGALGASGPTRGEDLAMARLLHTGGDGRGLGSQAPDLASMLSVLPPSFSPETAFPGLSRARIEASRPGIAAGEVPNIGGWGPETISTTHGTGPGSAPFPTAQPPDVTDPGLFRSMLPAAAQGAYNQLVAGGMPAAQAFSQALSGYIGMTTQSAQSLIQAVPPYTPPDWSGGGSGGSDGAGPGPSGATGDSGPSGATGDGPY